MMQAYLSPLQGPARARSDAYFEGGYWLPLWSGLVAVAVMLALLASGAAARLSGWAERNAHRRWLVPALFVLPCRLATALLTLPWTINADFVREKQHGLMNQRFGAWLGDRAKGVGVGLLAPAFLAPLFNSYTEMVAGPLRDRIVAAARAHDIPARHTYISDDPRRAKRVSANVSGLGPTVRITLDENLFRRTEPEEVVAVMGHEKGHHVLNHIPKMIAPAAVLFPLAAPVGLVLTPVQNSIIRHNEAEAEADAFGLDATRQPDGFAMTAIRLSEYRKLEQGALEEIFFDHPSGCHRIRRAMEWKAAHVPGATIVHPDPALLRR